MAPVLILADLIMSTWFSENEKRRLIALLGEEKHRDSCPEAVSLTIRENPDVKELLKDFLKEGGPTSP